MLYNITKFYHKVRRKIFKNRILKKGDILLFQIDFKAIRYTMTYFYKVRIREDVIICRCY